jgi:RNA polymerase sigma factor (sigma-70 family)
VVAVDAPVLEDAAAAACRAALRAGLREVDAHDLAQEALVRALTTAQPPSGVPLAAWVYGIARNLGRDHVKAARSRELLVDTASDVGGDAGDVATVLAVRRAVHELPDSLREVVTLHELEQLSLRETAETLAIPFDTAKDRLRRAREQLRESLGDAEYTAERTHTRRRAAAARVAIAVAALGALGERQASAAVAATAGGWLVRGWLAAAVAGALAVGGFAVGRVTAPTRDPAPASPPVAVATAIPVILPTPVPVPAPAPTPATTPTQSPAAARPAVRVAPDDPSRAVERLLLDRARAGIQRGLADEALVSLMAHARQYPSSAFAEERDVLIIEAYLAANNPELARRRIELYRADYPTGALHARVDAAAAQLAPQ